MAVDYVEFQWDVNLFVDDWYSRYVFVISVFGSVHESYQKTIRQRMTDDAVALLSHYGI